MKKLFTLLATLLLVASVFAQSPEKMSYQAVIRNSSDALVTNTQVGMQISILQGTADGSPVYVETQTPTTNANGLVSLEIGDGIVKNGDFSAINWANGPYFIKTEIDPAGETSYTITGTSQLLSVPYALHATTATRVTGDLNEADPVFINSPAFDVSQLDISNLQNLSGFNSGDQDLSGLSTRLELADSIETLRSELPDVDGFITDESDPFFNTSVAKGISEADTAFWNNQLTEYLSSQPLSIEGNTLSLSKGNSVTLPAGSGGTSLGKYMVIFTGNITDSEAALKVENEVGENTKIIRIFSTTQLSNIAISGVRELVELKVYSNAALNTISLPDLEISLENDFTMNPNLITIDMPSIVAGDIFRLNQNSELSSFNGAFHYLESMQISNCKLASLDLSQLSSVEKDLNISNVSQLSSLDIGNLEGNENFYTVRISNCEDLQTINLANLRSLQLFHIDFCNSLTSIDLSSLETFQIQFNFQNNNSINSISLPKFQGVIEGGYGGIGMFANSSLANIDMPVLQRFNTFNAFGCALTTSEIDTLLAQFVSLLPGISGSGLSLQGQNPPAPPSAQGQTNKTLLIDNNVSVETD